MQIKFDQVVAPSYQGHLRKPNKLSSGSLDLDRTCDSDISAYLNR
jgi:hypothetical protein